MNRRVSYVVALIALTVAAVGLLSQPVGAAKPLTFFEHRVGFACEEPWLSTGDGIAIVQAALSSESGPEGVVLFWAPPETPETAEATLRSTTDVPEVTVTDHHLDAVIPLEDQGFTPVGNAIISADLVPSGEPELGPGKSRHGNRTIRDNSVSQPLVVESGTLTLPDGTVFDLAGCPGSDLTIDIRSSNPDQFVIEAFEGILVVCDIAGDDYFLNLAASAEDNGTGGELFFSSPAGTIGGFAEGFTLTNQEFQATFPLIDFETEEPAGDAIVDVTFGDRRHVTLRTENSEGVRSKLVGWLLEPTGTITLPTEPTTIDLSSCFAFEGSQQDIQHRPDEPEE